MTIDSVSFMEINAMTDEELITRLVIKLNLHIRGTLPDTIEQEPYKLDIYWIFRSLHKKKRKPRHFADEILNQILPLLDSNDPLRRDKIIQEVQLMWKEWVYCWEHGLK